MRKPVLIVIDNLNDFLDQWEAARRRALTAATQKLVSLMREASCPIFWVRQEFVPDLRDAFAEMKANSIHITIRGTPGCQIVHEFAIASTDGVIVRKRYGAFFGTDLDAVLADLGAETIVLAGINTHACIRIDAIDAYQRDWP